ncbi:hypothetical protein E4665_14820, partial [Sporolactobacillus shoreae]
KGKSSTGIRSVLTFGFQFPCLIKYKVGEFLMTMWGIFQLTITAYVAFGNDANDVSMFTHASHAVMIGYHEELSILATERISMKDNVEQEIVKKITALSAYQF